MARINPAPAHMGGESIELTPLLNKIVAVMPIARAKVRTKWDERPMTQVAVLTVGAKEALVGVMFQSYFQGLKLGEWFFGRVVKQAVGSNEAWMLSMEGLTQKDIDAVKKTIEGAKVVIPGQQPLEG